MEKIFKFLVRILRRLRNLGRKFLTTYVVIAICATAVKQFYDTVPIYPIGYHSLFWVMALIFPGLAITYSLVRLRVRQNEILAVFRREGDIWNVYLGDQTKAMEPDEIEFAFEDYVQKRVDEYYGFWEFSSYSILAAIITLLATILVGQQFVIPKPNEPWELLGPTWAVLVGAAFLGSYTGSLAFLLRRYRAFDLRPTAFLQIAFMLIAGTAAGSFVTILYPEDITGFLAFCVGYLSAINIEFLSVLLRERFSKLTQIELPRSEPSDLPDMIKNPEAIEGLNAISIYSIRELSEADPIRLYLNIPQELSVIGAMIDEAILRANFPTIVDELKNVHITRFTQLISRLEPQFRRGNTTWTDSPKILGDSEKDNTILESVRSLFDNGTYHHTLGLLILRFRKAYFHDLRKPE